MNAEEAWMALPGASRSFCRYRPSGPFPGFRDRWTHFGFDLGEHEKDQIHQNGEERTLPQQENFPPTV